MAYYSRATKLSLSYERLLFTACDLRAGTAGVLFYIRWLKNLNHE